MSKIGVGVIGASPLRPGWAVTAHLPALLALSEYELRAVATSSEASAKAAGEAYGVPAYADPAAMIARADIDLVVVTVKLAHHHALVAAAIAAGKMVMCEWPLDVDFEQTADLAKQVALAGVGKLIGLQARMAPSIRYARDLVIQGYVGEVLGATMVASGIAWTSVSDSAHAYMFDATKNATLLSVPTMHALDALQFVVGDLADIRSASAVRRSAVRLADTNEEIRSTTPDHLAIAAVLDSGAVASIFYRAVFRAVTIFAGRSTGVRVTSYLRRRSAIFRCSRQRCSADKTRIRRSRHWRDRLSMTLRPMRRKGRPPMSPGSMRLLPLTCGWNARDTAPDFAHALRLHRTLDLISAAAASGIANI